MKVDQNTAKVTQYWSLNSHSHEEDFEQTAANVRELVYDSIKRQLISDVPLCTLLSGGLDSSAITSIASQVYRNENKEPVNTFSIDYIGNDRYFQASVFQPDADAPWIKNVSDYLGTRHSSFFIDTPELT